MNSIEFRCPSLLRCLCTSLTPTSLHDAASGLVLRPSLSLTVIPISTHFTHHEQHASRNRRCDVV